MFVASHLSHFPSGAVVWLLSLTVPLPGDLCIVYFVVIEVIYANCYTAIYNQARLTAMSFNSNIIQKFVQHYCLNSENVRFLRHEL